MFSGVPVFGLSNLSLFAGLSLKRVRAKKKGTGKRGKKCCYELVRGTHAGLRGSCGHLRLGIVVLLGAFGGLSEPRIEGCRFELCTIGIDCTQGDVHLAPEIVGCEFRDCGVGFEISTLYDSDPVLEDCAFFQCATGVDVHFGYLALATCRITDSRFLGCDRGIAYQGGPGAAAGWGSAYLELRRSEIRGSTDFGLRVRANTTFGDGQASVYDTLIANCADGVIADGATLERAAVGLQRCTVTANVQGLRGVQFYLYDLENSVVWGNGVDVDTPAVGLGTPYAVDWSDVHVPGQPPSGTNLDVDPLFANAGVGDYRLSAGSPLVDAGDPASPPGGTDADGDPRLLDGALDGAARLDVGYDEFNHVALSSPGAALLGGSLVLHLSAPAGWVYLQAFALLPGDTDYGALGSLLLEPTTLALLAAGTAPGSDAIPLPAGPGLAGLVLYLQSVALDPATGLGSLSNRLERVLE